MTMKFRVLVGRSQEDWLQLNAKIEYYELLIQEQVTLQYSVIHTRAWKIQKLFGLGTVKEF